MGHYQHRKSPLPAYFCIVKRPWIPSRGNKTPSSNCSQYKLHYRFQWLECEGCSDALYSTELPKKEMDSQAANWVFVLCSVRTTKCAFHSMKNSGLIFWWWMEQHQPGIPEKRTALWGIPNCSEISYREFPFHSTFLQKFSKFFGWKVRFSEIQQFPDFLETLFVPVSKFYEFSVEWKAQIGTTAIWQLYPGNKRFFSLSQQLLLSLTATESSQNIL